MPSIVVMKEKLANPKEWFEKEFQEDGEWETDSFLGGYRLGNIYLKEGEDYTSFEDTEELAFLGWDTESWIKLAAGKELMYGYYSDEQLEAEFVHVRDGKCIRDYRVYDGEVETNVGDTPEFGSWVDVATYVDKYLL